MEFQQYVEFLHTRGKMNSVKITEKLIKQLLAVRHKRVQQLRSKILRGKYQVKSEDLAKSLFIPVQQVH